MVNIHRNDQTETRFRLRARTGGSVRIVNVKCWGFLSEIRSRYYKEPNHSVIGEKAMENQVPNAKRGEALPAPNAEVILPWACG